MDGRDDDTTLPEEPTRSEAPAPDGPAGREGQGDPAQAPGTGPEDDEGRRPGDAGEQPVAEDAPGSLGGDNGGA